MTRRILSILQKYYLKGWLDNGAKYLTADERLAAGEHLQRDYYLAHLSEIRAVDLERLKVDNSPNGTLEYVLNARVRFNAACKAVRSSEIWRILSRVCCEDLPLQVRHRNAQTYRRYYRLLNEGLDTLCCHYGRRKP